MKAFKSKILGAVFIAVGIILLLKGVTTDYLIIGGFEIGGVLLFFTGDRFINKLEKFVFGRVLLSKNQKQMLDEK